ncbi:MAG: hypothetical protein ABI321_21650 [Polyangia bacterium]
MSGVLGLGIATAHADGWDRDRESGSIRQQQFQESISRERPMATDQSISGRAFGRDTLGEAGIGREFRSAQDMSSHMNQQTQMRATAGHESPASDADVSRPNGTHTLTTPAMAQARDAQHSKTSRPVSDDVPLTAMGNDIVNGASSGKKLGSDTAHVGDIYQDFQSKGDMMRHMNTATSLRISAGGEAGGTDNVGTAPDGTMGPLAKTGEQESPARMTDRQLAVLRHAGVMAARPSSSADVEDKTP